MDKQRTLKVLRALYPFVLRSSLADDQPKREQYHSSTSACMQMAPKRIRMNKVKAYMRKKPTG